VRYPNRERRSVDNPIETIQEQVYEYVTDELGEPPPRALESMLDSWMRHTAMVQDLIDRHVCGSPLMKSRIARDESYEWRWGDETYE
jgi:hypothetical protein